MPLDAAVQGLEAHDSEMDLSMFDDKDLDAQEMVRTILYYQISLTLFFCFALSLSLSFSLSVLSLSYFLFFHFSF